MHNSTLLYYNKKQFIVITKKFYTSCNPPSEITLLKNKITVQLQLKEKNPRNIHC